jgi:hypothetical protein
MASPYLQLGAGIAGAVIGSYFGPTGAAIGFSLGSMVFAPDAPGAAKIDPGDLSFSTSSYGKFMVWGYGIFPHTSVPFWSTNWQAKKHEEGGGKGGGGAPETAYYTYKRSFAMYLCDCTQGGPIIGIRAIENAVTGEVLYYVGDDADAATIAASKKFAAAVRVYTGTDTQDPDPLIEATQGWSPAWRGHAYLVIEDMKFGTSKQAIPLRVEVIRGGVVVAPPTLVEPWAMTTNSWNMSDGLLTNAS